ncbi:hypothetical protein V6N13_015868 [Hibiscus sabdariffa]
MNLQCLVGNGSDTRFWHDSWMQDIGPLIRLVPQNAVNSLGSPSVADMVNAHGDWRWDVLQGLLPRSVLLRLSALKSPQPWFPKDNLCWAGESDGRFTRPTAHAESSVRSREGGTMAFTGRGMD